MEVQLFTLFVAVILSFTIGFFVGRFLLSLKSRAFELQVNLLNDELDHLRLDCDKKIAAMSQTKTEELSAQKQDFKERMDQLIETFKEEKLYEQSLRKEALQDMEFRHRESIAEMQGAFAETLEKVKLQMQTSTEKLLKDREREFAETNTSKMDEIVSPLKATIEDMRKAMDDNTKNNIQTSSALKENLEQMMQHSKDAQRSAEELTRVFKHGSKVQGDWGETVLDELLSSQGLTKGQHYDTQATIRDAQGNVILSDGGNSLRPDVILHIDRNKEVIIDSKVSMTAFIDYVNAESDVEREKALKEHVASLSKHVDELSRKDYSSYIKAPKVKMDYVIMFVPHTGALWTALNAKPSLWREAMSKNVFIADEQTLYAALRMVKMTWIQITQAQNHEKLYDLANEMIKRVGIFCKHYHDVGRNLSDAVKAYNEGEKKLKNEGQSILNASHKMIELGAKENAKNPLPSGDDLTELPMPTSVE